ncbi:MAG TPA: NAD(P)-binding domain-containing protein, partial [Thermoanaerobaculia bacterium]|nr:NAD(P)-binding domain-containing protein [Thermoanaerobaculia bacterium]
MKIAILGAGNVGGALGTGWARKGHTVVFGTRDAGADG